jgi:hypothetical protein
MAPKFDNFVDGSVGGLGGALGQYFKWNFSQSPAGISTYNAAANAGLRPSTAFGASLLTTAGLQYATNNALLGRDRDQKKPTFGDTYTWEDQAWDSTIGLILPNQGKVPRTYGDYLAQVKKNGGSQSQTLSEDAYNAWKNAEYNQGGIFRLNREGEGSELVGRDTATFFNRTVTNPLYAYDGTLGRENVDRLTAGVGLAGLGGSAAALKGYTDLAKLGSTVGATPAYNLGDTSKIIGGSALRGLGVAATVYGGITDFAESKKAGDSDFRAATNATFNVGGALAGAAVGGQAAASLSAPLLATPAAPAVPFIVGAGTIGGAVTGSGIGGWLSDRALDLFGEKKSNESSADDLYRAADARLQRALEDKQLRETGTSDMATPRTTTNTGTRTTNNIRQSDYAPGEKANLDRFKIQLDAMNQRYGIDATTGANLQNYQWQSQDRQFATKVNAGETRVKTYAELQAALDRNQVTREVGLDSNRVTREVGLDSNRVTREVGLNRNQLQSGDNRFETTTKYGTQERMNAYNRNTVDKTAIAEATIKASSDASASDAEITKAKIQAGIYGLSLTDVKNMFYGRYQMEVQKFNDQRGWTERSYSDQRRDLSSARFDANVRYNQEMAMRAAERAEDMRQRELDRDRVKYEFDVRRNDTNATLAQQNAFRQQELAFRQQEINNSSALDQARIAQIYADTKLKNDQFGAGRADISYNRNIQRSRSIAF